MPANERSGALSISAGFSIPQPFLKGTQQIYNVWQPAQPSHLQRAEQAGAQVLMRLWCAVGVLAAHCCQHRGATEIVIIDEVPFRLDFAKKHIPGIKTINFRSAGPCISQDLLRA